MTNNEKLQKIISAYNTIPFYLIDLDAPLKNVYVFEGFKDNLAHDICKAWDEVPCTDIHNELFDSLNTGNEIFKQYNIDGNATYK